MKRVVSFDALRGIAIFFVLLFHLVIFYLKADWNAMYNLNNQSLTQTITKIAIMYFPGWAGFFLMISMAANSYVFTNRFLQGVKLEILLKKQLYTGIVLLIVAIIADAIFSPFGFIFSSIIKKQPDWEKLLERLIAAETVQIIALSLMITSAILYKLYKKHNPHAHYRQIVTILLLATITIYVLTPIIRPKLQDINYSWVKKPAQLLVAFLLKWVISYLAAPIGEPLFPYLGTALIGAIIGITLTLPTPPPHFLKTLVLGGITLKITAIILHLNGLSLYPLNRKNYTFYLFVTGGQLILLAGFLWATEYGNLTTIMTKYTTLFRRWSIISFTIFTFEIISLPPALAFYFLFKWNTLTWQQLNLYQTIIIVTITMIYWDMLIRFWAKTGFKGSLEWILLKLLSKGPLKSSKSLSIEKQVYNIAPLVFKKDK